MFVNLAVTTFWTVIIVEDTFFTFNIKRQVRFLFSFIKRGWKVFSFWRFSTACFKFLLGFLWNECYLPVHKETDQDEHFLSTNLLSQNICIFCDFTVPEHNVDSWWFSLKFVYLLKNYKAKGHSFMIEYVSQSDVMSLWYADIYLLMKFW